MSSGTAARVPPILWGPPADLRDRTQIGRYVDGLASGRGLAFGDYAATRNALLDPSALDAFASYANHRRTAV